MGAAENDTKVRLFQLPDDVTEEQLGRAIGRNNLEYEDITIGQAEAIVTFRTLYDAFRCLSATICVRRCIMKCECEVQCKLAEHLSITSDDSGRREVTSEANVRAGSTLSNSSTPQSANRQQNVESGRGSGPDSGSRWPSLGPMNSGVSSAERRHGNNAGFRQQAQCICSVTRRAVARFLSCTCTEVSGVENIGQCLGAL